MDVTITAPILEPVWIAIEDVNRLDQLCDGTGKSRSDVVSAALYFLEQSLLYDPCLDMEVIDNERDKRLL